MKTRRRGAGIYDFPKGRNVTYKSLRMTPEGEYSMTKRADGEKLLRIMRGTLKSLKDKTITDLTGNVGSDTILFGLHFKNVKSIEINPENFEVLKHNVETYGLQNIELMLGDSTKVYSWNTDALYIDAPWGGPDYKTKQNLDLFLGEVRLDTFLSEVLSRKNRPSFVFLKLPRNYNFSRLNDLGVQVKLSKIRGFFIATLTS
jgi:predicted RNA methylase